MLFSILSFYIWIEYQIYIFIEKIVLHIISPQSMNIFKYKYTFVLHNYSGRPKIAAGSGTRVFILRAEKKTIDGKY